MSTILYQQQQQLQIVEIFHSRLLCYPRNSDNGSTRSGCIPSKRAWASTSTRSSAAEGESCPFETAKKTAVSSTNETKGLDGVLLEASTKKLALLDYNRKSLFGNVKLSKCTRGQYKSMMHQLQKFCIRTADYSTLMILQLNAPLVSPFYVRISSSVNGIVDPSFPQTHVQLLSPFPCVQNSPSMDADTLALFIKFKSGEKGCILVDKHGQQVFDTQGRPILPEGAKSKYHQCNNLRGAWGTWANVNSFRAAVRLVHIMHHNHAGQTYGISQACCEQAVK